MGSGAADRPLTLVRRGTAVPRTIWFPTRPRGDARPADARPTAQQPPNQRTGCSATRRWARCNGSFAELSAPDQRPTRCAPSCTTRRGAAAAGTSKRPRGDARPAGAAPKPDPPMPATPRHNTTDVILDLRPDGTIRAWSKFYIVRGDGTVGSGDYQPYLQLRQLIGRPRTRVVNRAGLRFGRCHAGHHRARRIRPDRADSSGSSPTAAPVQDPPPPPACCTGSPARVGNRAR
jgi:hypothetical protein